MRADTHTHTHTHTLRRTYTHTKVDHLVLPVGATDVQVAALRVNASALPVPPALIDELSKNLF
jgi:hypothetical protein